MGPETDYIIVEDAKNLSDDTANKSTDTKPEDNEDSTRTLEAQGIFVEDSATTSDATINHLDFKKELQEQGGIEIISSEEGIEFL